MSSRKRLFVFPSLILIVLLLTTVLAGGIAAQAKVDEVLALSITKLSAEPVPVRSGRIRRHTAQYRRPRRTECRHAAKVG